MHDENSFISVTLVVLVAFLVPVLLYRLKIRAVPVVAAEIVFGLLLGKSGLGWIQEDQWLQTLSTLGLIYLMFLSGLEIDFSYFGQKRKNRKLPPPLAVSLSIFVMILGLSYLLARALVVIGLVDDAILITIIIATISLGVVMPVLKEKKLMNTPLGQIIMMITVVSDFVTMILLSIYISYLSHSFIQMVYLLLFFFGVAIVYLLIRKYSARSVVNLLSHGTIQLGMRGTFALLLFFVAFSAALGVESILGAFLAGCIVSLLRPKKEFVQRLDSFGYGFLIPIFFVMVGAKLEIWSLFTDWHTFAFIPVLLVFLLISKLVPASILRIWFSTKETLGSGILMASTLSLLIAASTIALKLGLITESVYGSLILIALISCIVFPVLFSKIFPLPEDKPVTIGIVGANHMTLPVSSELAEHGNIVTLYSAGMHDSAHRANANPAYRTENVKELSVEELDGRKLFASDILVLGTADDEVNAVLAAEARRRGKEQTVVRIEDPAKYEELYHEGYTVFSTLHASRTLLRALIEQPGMVKLFTQDGESREFVIENPAFDRILLRELPDLGDVLILRIFREGSHLVPHGNTELQLGDRLLLSGSEENIERLRSQLRG